MNILTPVPVTVANHRGVATHHITQRYKINTFKASALVGQIPLGVSVKHKYSGIEYRYTARTSDPQHNYSRVSTMTLWTNAAGHIESTGWVHKEEDLKLFMDTFHLIHPIMLQLFRKTEIPNTGTAYLRAA